MIKRRYEYCAETKMIIDNELDNYVEDVVERLNTQDENKKDLLKQYHLVEDENEKLKDQLHTQPKEIVEKIKDLSGDYFYENNQNDLLLTGTDFTEILDEILKEYGGEIK